MSRPYFTTRKDTPIMAKQVTIVSGDVSDEAVQWLKAHGAQVEGIDLLTITLPEQARVQKGSHG